MIWRGTERRSCHTVGPLGVHQLNTYGYWFTGIELGHMTLPKRPCIKRSCGLHVWQPKWQKCVGYVDGTSLVYTCSVQFMFYLTTWESLIGHSRWALPHYTEMGHSSSSFWGTASLDRGSNPRPPVPMALNIPEGHRGIGSVYMYVLAEYDVRSYSLLLHSTVSHSIVLTFSYLIFKEDLKLVKD